MAQDVTALDEPKRLGALRSYEILDTQPEPAFDRLAQLAAVPIRPNPPHLRVTTSLAGSPGSPFYP
jgi:hypothetical protein